MTGADTLCSTCGVDAECASGLNAPLIKAGDFATVSRRFSTRCRASCRSLRRTVRSNLSILSDIGIILRSHRRGHRRCAANGSPVEFGCHQSSSSMLSNLDLQLRRDDRIRRCIARRCSPGSSVFVLLIRDGWIRSIGKGNDGKLAQLLYASLKLGDDCCFSVFENNRGQTGGLICEPWFTLWLRKAPPIKYCNFK
jgi:hypothetical protein